MKSGEYWKQRFDILEAAQNKSAEQSRAEIEQQFKIAQKELESQISTWYSRFAKNNQISMAEARQWLNTKDLAEFKWDVKEYIKYGEQAGMNAAWMKQLENASARFHISRLEALKMQTQQTMEKLFTGQTNTATALMKKTYLEGYYHTAYEINKGLNIGWDIAAVNDSQLEKILSKPWTADNRTFSDNIWKDKQTLLNSVHTQLTQNIILGKPPDVSIRQIEKLLGETDKKGARYKAGRLVMTESAYFSNLAQQEAFKTLDVEEYEVVETLDGSTCEICGAMDGKHFTMVQFEPGVTAPPFHCWCRGCTAPYFGDDLSIGERAARDDNGKTYYVPDDMPYKEWKETFVDGTASKDGLDVYEANGTVHYTKPKADVPDVPEPPKKEYLTKKKLQTNIADADNQITNLYQQQKDLMSGYTYDELIKDYGSIDAAYGDDLSADDLIEKTKLLELQSQIEHLEAEKQAWQTKLDEKLLVEEKKKLTKQEMLLQEQFDQLEIKTYSDIWKDDVTTADWNAKKASVQGKKDYFQSKLNEVLSDEDRIKFEKLLADLDEFNLEGEKYFKVQSELKKVKADLTKLNSGDIIKNDTFSQERKDAALWAKTTKDADDFLRDVSGNAWRNASNAQKDAIYEYTGSYSKFNEPLRGYEYGTNKFLGVGNVNLDEIGINYGGYKRGQVKKLIDDMTAIIEKSSYEADVWVQRGVNYTGMDKFFAIDPDDFYLSESDLASKLLGTTPTDYGFFSTGVAKGKGFSSKPIIMNVYAPAGTKMMYAEPFSQYGQGARRAWDGISKQTSFGSESEMIFQRGTQFKVVKVEKSGSTIYIDLEVIGQGVN